MKALRRLLAPAVLSGAIAAPAGADAQNRNTQQTKRQRRELKKETDG